MSSKHLRICINDEPALKVLNARAGEDTVGAAHAASLRRAAAEAAEAVGEDHMSAAWRAHRKHVFVLTNAGTLLLAGLSSWHRSIMNCAPFDWDQNAAVSLSACWSEHWH